MKISSTPPSTPVLGVARSAARTDSFSPTPTASAGESAATSAGASVGALSSLESLLALQEQPGPMERRRRAVGRAGRLLDVLDGVKLSLLGETVNGAQIESLKAAIRERRFGTDDTGLEGVLDEIETRAEVELAKQDMARRAA